jgi:hypothetical protein
VVQVRLRLWRRRHVWQYAFSLSSWRRGEPIGRLIAAPFNQFKQKKGYIMKTTIVVTASEYAKIKAIFNACSKDEHSEVLQYAFYSAQNRHIIATDGHILRIEDMDLGDMDLLLNQKYFNLSAAQQKAVYGSDWLKYNFINAEIEIEFSDDLQYPQYWKIIPQIDRCKANDNAPLFGIDLELVSRFQKSIVFEGKFSNVVLVPTSSINAILVYSAESCHFYGLIMPRRADETIEKIRQWSPIPEDLHKEIEAITA